jgi:hypothetical protein
MMTALRLQHVAMAQALLMAGCPKLCHAARVQIPYSEERKEFPLEKSWRSVMRDFLHGNGTAIEWDVRAYCRRCDKTDGPFVAHQLDYTRDWFHVIDGFQFYAARSYAPALGQEWWDASAQRAKEYPGPTHEEYYKRLPDETGYTFFGQSDRHIDPFATGVGGGNQVYTAFFGPPSAGVGVERQPVRKPKPSLRDLRAQNRANQRKR